MKFNIFSKKKKKEKSASIKATDFLNPRDSNLNNLESDDKISKDKSDKKKKNSKKETKVSKKELRKAEKKKKAEAKKEAKKKAREEAKKKKVEMKKKKKEDEKKKKEDEEKKKQDEEKRDKERKDLEKKEDSNKKIKETKEEQATAKENEDLKAVENEGNKKNDKVKSQDKQDLEDNKNVKAKEQSKKDGELSPQTTSNHEFEKSNILEINLVKDEINVYFDWYKNIAMLVVFIFLSFILITEIYLALSWWQGENDSAVSQEEGRFIQISEEIKKIRSEAEEALSFQTKLNRANYILDNHIYWTSFFDYLEKNTLEDVNYTGFQGDILGKFFIPAVSGSFPSLGQQIYQLKSDTNTLQASIESGEKQETEEENFEQVEFELELQVNPELFKK